jgi:hypothetical protein
MPQSHFSDQNPLKINMEKNESFLNFTIRRERTSGIGFGNFEIFRFLVLAV